MMYQDNSLWAASKFKDRLTVAQEMRLLKQEREMNKLKGMLDKRNLVHFYDTNYGIKIDPLKIERLSEK